MSFGANRDRLEKTAMGPRAAVHERARNRDRNRLRPALLPLEERRLLATFPVTSAADSAPANDPAMYTLRWATQQANEATNSSTIDIELGSAAATITLLKGPLTLSNDASAITIYDGPGEGPVTISGNNASRVFQVDNGVTASISGLTITGGTTGKFSGLPGGGLYNKGGTMIMTGCTISNNYADVGGGLANNRGTSTLTDCTISGNSTGEGGGSGLANYVGTVTLSNCTITGNPNGGMLNLATAMLSDCTISDNTSPDGGGIDNRGTVSLSNCTINNNYGGVGGGLFSDPGVAGTGASLTNCTISGNSSADGGGVECGSDSLTLSGCEVTGNYALFQAGGVGTYGNGTTTLLTNCTISGNSTNSAFNAFEGYGGGVVNGIRSKSKMSLVDCIVSNNSAYSDGGLTNGTYANLTLSGCTISGNTAQGEFGAGGGGLGNGRYDTVMLTDCTISDNVASAAVDAGGGGLSSGGDGSTATLIDCTISGNSAQSGGGIDGATTVTGCTISGNSAQSGGGIVSDGTVTGCTISGNTALYGGGLAGGGGLLTNCTISGNYAHFGGGIEGSFTLTACTIAGNSAYLYGGLADGDQKLIDTIVVGNTDSNGASEIAGYGTASGTYNLIGTGGSGGLTNGVDGNIVGVADPLLSALGNYGGSTETIALLPGSPAIGTGSSVSGVTTDQRDVTRPTAGVDIGAFQSQGFTLTPVAGSTPQSATVNTAFANALAVTVTANDPLEPVVGGDITFTAPRTGASTVLSGMTATISPNGVASVTATANGMAGSYAVSATASGVATPAAFDLTNTTGGPSNVTSDLSVKAGGFVYNRTSRQFTQTLTITNISGAAISGPIELMLVNLKNASLVNQSGTYQGNPYITILSNGSLGVGQSLTITLTFADPTLAAISYTSEFLAGPLPPPDESN
jgi:hypothetical protein